jgi:hypothetical protein
MPSLNKYTVVRWRVIWAGNTAAVVPDGSTSISVLVPDGGTVSPDTQVIAEYLLSIDQAERAAATQNVADGLITFIPVQKFPITAPPVPPRILAAGPPVQQPPVQQVQIAYPPLPAWWLGGAAVRRIIR